MMQDKYILTPKEVEVLRALNRGIVEISLTEIAVLARLLPNQARIAVAKLERYGLVNSWHPVTGRVGEQLVVLTDEGQVVVRILAQFQGTPPAGTIIRLPSKYLSFSGWRGGQESISRVEIAADESDHLGSAHQ